MTSVGLVGAGAVSRSLLSRLPHLRRHLGPVASFSYRLAARIVNALRAGSAVRNAADLNSCQLILICAPNTGFDRAVSMLLQAPLDWKNKQVLFFDSLRFTTPYPEFRDRGALLGSLNSFEDFRGAYMVEGDPAAVRHAKQLVRELRGRAVEVAPESVEFINAAKTFSTSFFTASLESCMECLRGAGIESKLASQLVGALFERSLRAYLHSGRRSWSGPVSRADTQTLKREMQYLQEARPLLGEYYRTSADFAMAFYRTFPELTRYKPAKWRNLPARYAGG